MDPVLWLPALVTGVFGVAIALIGGMLAGRNSPLRRFRIELAADVATLKDLDRQMRGHEAAVQRLRTSIARRISAVDEVAALPDLTRTYFGVLSVFTTGHVLLMLLGWISIESAIGAKSPGALRTHLDVLGCAGLLYSALGIGLMLYNNRRYIHVQATLQRVASGEVRAQLSLTGRTLLTSIATTITVTAASALLIAGRSVAWLGLVIPVAVAALVVIGMSVLTSVHWRKEMRSNREPSRSQHARLRRR